MAMRFRLCALAGGLLALGACHALIARTFAGQMLDRTHLVKTFDESFGNRAPSPATASRNTMPHPAAPPIRSRGIRASSISSPAAIPATRAAMACLMSPG